MSASWLFAGAGRHNARLQKKLLRIHRVENLWFRSCGGRKRALGTMPMVLPDGPNQRWSLDFVSDTLTCSRRFRILCMVDDYQRNA